LKDRLGEQELGHIHLDGEAHIPFGGALGTLLIEAKLARRSFFGAKLRDQCVTSLEAMPNTSIRPSVLDRMFAFNECMV